MQGALGIYDPIWVCRATVAGRGGEGAPVFLLYMAYGAVDWRTSDSRKDDGCEIRTFSNTIKSDISTTSMYLPPAASEQKENAQYSPREGENNPISPTWTSKGSDLV